MAGWMASAARGSPLLDLEALTRRPSALYLWGSSRSVVLRTLYAIARANDPEMYWFEIEAPPEAPPEPGPSQLGWIPQDHLFMVSRPEELRPVEPPEQKALFTVVRSDEPRDSVGEVTDFLTLPALAQETISRMATRPGSQVIVLANTDQLREYYPPNSTGFRHVLEPFLSAHLSPFLAGLAPPPNTRWAYDFVFEARAPSSSAWQEGSLVCEKALADSGFRPGDSIPFRSLPSVAAVFRSGTRRP